MLEGQAYPTRFIKPKRCSYFYPGQWVMMLKWKQDNDTIGAIQTYLSSKDKREPSDFIIKLAMGHLVTRMLEERSLNAF